MTSHDVFEPEPGARLRHEAAGEGDPLIVLDVGVLPDMEPLARGRRLLELHSRGRGGSSRIEDPALLGPRQEARDAVALADPCRWENEWPASSQPRMRIVMESRNRSALAARRRAAPALVIHGDIDFIPAGRLRGLRGADPRCAPPAPARRRPLPHIERPDVFYPALDAFLAGGWPEGAIERRSI